ncbi:hypothetical protein [Alsobacter sp. R-9]
MIRVFVGCAASGEDAESLAVLEFSIRARASEPVEIVYMHQTHDDQSFWHGWNTERWATPFSGYRWGIPAFCNYTGRAIYTDSDVIFLADIAELWHQDMGGKAVLAKAGSWRMCVSLWDCAAARSHLPPIDAIRDNPASHAQIGQRFRDPTIVGAFKGQWNCLDGEDVRDLLGGEIKALHYTDMSCQPHLRHALPRLEAAGRKHWFDGTVRRHPRRDVEELFDRSLKEAIAAGYPPSRYIPNDWFGDYRKASLVNYRKRA